MKKRPIRVLLLLSLVAGLFLPTKATLAQTPSVKLSANLPLNSHLYLYLEKLDGLGVLTVMPTGTKPYTRMQIAGWVKSIHEQSITRTQLPDYAQTMLDQLTVELSPELAVLNGETSKKSGIAFREWKLNTSGYGGESLVHRRTKSVYQPLDINQNGYHLTDGFNGMVGAEIEARAGADLLFELGPRLDLAEGVEAALSLESGYVKTRYQNLAIQLGKDARWWGPGERGNFGLTNNATAFTALQFSNLEPIRPQGIVKLMRQVDLTAFYANLEANRSDVNHPGFFGFRADVTPSSNFTVAGTLTAMLGGAGHELHPGDLWNFITGENALTAVDDKWNTIAGFDFRWRIQRLRGVQLYGELYGEDQAGKIPLPSHDSYLAGVYLPRLTRDGRWDLKIEMAKTINCSYDHSLYTDGYTFKNNLIGDAMGNFANRYYLKLARYLAGGESIAVHAEHLVTEQAASAPQEMDSFWIAYQARLKPDLTLNTALGVANLTNFNRQAGNSQRNYLGRIAFTKRF